MPASNPINSPGLPPAHPDQGVTRQVLAELKHRGLDATRQSEMWAEIIDVVSRCVEPTESTIHKLLNK